MTASANRPTDLELLDRVRAGDLSAFGTLWARYEGWALHVARRTTSRFDADDIVQEASAKILTSLRNGKGPVEGFAHYLRTAIRNVAATWGAREARTTLVPLPEDGSAGSYRFEVNDLGDLERPFRSLPERWQQVLVLTVLQQLPVATVSRLMGVTPAGATALAARARAGLRAALVSDGEELALAA
ncbi:sigma-70 family RNA polymerase sigma factor [Leifsonia sp. ku-ls]|nr:sigma-70 family RNA polymerase sigma factor [Leifsonia sp. ku-ls]